MTREEFTAQIRMLCEVIDCDSSVAEYCKVSLGTIRRWRSGAAVPLPKARVVYVNAIKELIAND